MRMIHCCAVIVLCLSPLASCVSIPAEAPELSGELGKRIAAIESAHTALLGLYFDDKRDRVDEFMTREWIPTFAAAVMNEPAIKAAWNQVCASGSNSDKIEFMTGLGPRLQKQINDKRLEFIKPLDDLERSIEAKLRGEYRQAYAINSAVTSFLASASEVAANRDRYLGMLGATDEVVNGLIDDVDSAVTDLVDLRASGADKLARAVTYKAKLDGLLDQLKN